MPKVGFLEHDGQLVQVTPLFGGSKTKSKLFESKTGEIQLSDELLEKFVDHCIAITNAGYKIPFDSAHFIKKSNGAFEPIVIDFDSFAVAPVQKHSAGLFYDNAFHAFSILRWMARKQRFEKEDSKNFAKLFFGKLPQTSDAETARKKFMTELDLLADDY